MESDFRKILKTLNDNLTQTTSVSANQKFVKEVEESFKTLLNYLKDFGKGSISDTISNASKFFIKYLSIFDKYITCSNNMGSESSATTYIDTFALYSLRALGFFLFASSSIEQLNEIHIKDITKLLENTIRSSKNKNIVNYALWCLSSQNFPNGPISDTLPEVFIELLSKVPFDSKTIESEAISSFVAVFNQNQEQYIETCPYWVPLLYAKQFDNKSNLKIMEKIDFILSGLVSYFQSNKISVPEELSNLLLSKYSRICDQMIELYKHAGCEVYSIQSWGYFVYFLGSILFEKKDVVNAILKVPELGFIENDKPEIQICTFKTWKYFIQSFDAKSLSHNNRLKLVMQPIWTCMDVHSENDRGVRKSCFGTWLTLLHRVTNQNLTKVWKIVMSDVIKQLMKQDQFLYEIALNFLAYLFGSSVENKREFRKRLQDADVKEPLIEPLPSGGSLTSQFITTTFTQQFFSEIIQGEFHNSFTKAKLEIWTGCLRRIQELKSLQDQELTGLLQNILLFLQHILVTLDTTDQKTCSNDELNYYKQLYQVLLYTIQVPLLNSSLSIQVQEEDRSFVPIEFIMMNLMEFGFKLTTKQNNDILYPVLNEYFHFAIQNSTDISKRLNFIRGIMEENISFSEINQTLMHQTGYLFGIWELFTRVVQAHIEKSTVLTLPITTLQHILVELQHLLFWPLLYVSQSRDDQELLNREIEVDDQLLNEKIVKTPSTEKKPGTSKVCWMDMVNKIIIGPFTDLWKNLFQNIIKIFPIKIPINSFFTSLLKMINDSQVHDIPWIMDFILNVVTMIVDNYELKSDLKQDKYFLYNLEVINRILAKCHHSESGNVHVFKSTTLLTCLSNMILRYKEKNPKSFPLILDGLRSSLLLYIRDPKPNIDNINDHMEKYNCNQISRVARETWETILRCVKQDGTYQSENLLYLEQYLLAGFQSKAIEIKQITFDFWNETFAMNSLLSYPSNEFIEYIKAVRDSVKDQLPLNLPNFSKFESGYSTIPFQKLEKAKKTLIENDYYEASLGIPPPSEMDRLEKVKSKLEVPDKKRESTISHSQNGQPSKKLRNSKEKDDYVLVNSNQTYNSAATQSLTDHQMEVLERQNIPTTNGDHQQPLKKQPSLSSIVQISSLPTYSSTSGSSSSSSVPSTNSIDMFLPSPVGAANNVILQTNRINSDNTQMIINQLQEVYSTSFDNQSLQNLVSMQQITTLILQKVNNTLANRITSGIGNK
ncbi:hypothetical protein DLAC_05865 [Tieghemostelium lacteum]|uniref:Telomere-associated protein Rif1 N-terminal domain-containing protein n=1 Tax=Tieghemostelium lacteum TaxID=361077 RepID=A0A151ZGX8_TIELA|nr:hypothetical protein DLAC_05865 [Tieghemostelium lacteum]|eukprot:KYQ93223.1 hypothetical protein DLAC_05865 [Tieghemostelium lacteum]